MNLSRRTRILLLSLGGVVLALALGAVLAVHLLLQPQRFTKLLESAADAAGLRLELSEPASPELFPSPGLVLQGLSLSLPGHATPMLSVNRGKLFVPWRALLGGEPVITQLELDGPQIDLDELSAYVASLPTGKAPWLPRIRTGIHLGNGVLTSNGRNVLNAINITTGQLEPDQPFSLDISARNMQMQTLQLQIHGTPRSSPALVSMNPLDIRGSIPGDGDFKLAGHAGWLGGDRVRLALRGTAGKPAIQLQLSFANVSGKALLDVEATRPGQKLQARFDPTALVAWWNNAITSSRNLPPLTQPPLAASASAAQLDVGPVHIEGLEASIDATPAPVTSSTGKPAPRTTKSKR